MNKKSEIICSFCKKLKQKVKFLAVKNENAICNFCINLCKNIINKKLYNKKKEFTTKLLKPFELKKYLDSYVVGQEQAKKILCIAVHNHYKRILNIRTSNIRLEKSNILLLGPTGSGKTLLVKTLAKVLNVPFIIVDATSLTEAGYVGEDIESIVSNLINIANNDIKKAERGIIYIDEIDKITRKNKNVSITRDVSGEGVQQALLKLIEGTICNVLPIGEKKHTEHNFIKINTSQILFICGGTFNGLEKIILDRLRKNFLGFKNYYELKKKNIDNFNVFSYIQSEDLLKFGFIPEFIGRLPAIAFLENLSENILISILTKPKNALVKQYQQLLYMDGVILKVTGEALNLIAKKAFLQKIGARGLRNILENILLNVMYEIPERKDIIAVVINKDSVLENVLPKIFFK